MIENITTGDDDVRKLMTISNDLKMIVYISVYILTYSI